MRWVLVGEATSWIALELRQSITRRPEGVKASWTSEVLFRLVVWLGALGAGALSGMACHGLGPSALPRRPTHHGTPARRVSLIKAARETSLQA